MKRLLKGISLVFVGMLMITACGQAEESEPESQPADSQPVQETEISEPESQPQNEATLPDGMAYSVYTGLLIPEGVTLKQPVAIVLNNIWAARPQSGVAGADIIYETEAEGGITRLVGIFQNYADLNKIGSIRSARRAFLDFALDQGAVLLHYGQDDNIKDVYDAIGCRHMEGLSYLDGSMTWRSSDRKAPHNVYTSGERIREALKTCGYETELIAPQHRVFHFLKEWTEPAEGQEAAKVSLPIFDAEFVYNEEKKAYERYQDGDRYVDLETGEAVTFTNVLMQRTSIQVGSDGLHMDIQTIGSGEGYYLTGGRVLKVTWEKTSQQEPTRWYKEDGTELLLNPGTTWINVIRAGASVNFE